MDVRWKVPFTALLAGNTGCGKTTFILRFLSNLDSMTDQFINQVIWCYSVMQDFQDSITDSRVTFHKGIPNMDDFSAESGPKLIILDDMMSEIDNRVVDLFTKYSHHKNISIFFITQNLFHKGIGMRDVSLNSHYIVCFRNPRDRKQFSFLAKQINPKNVKFLEEAYEDSTKLPYGYLLVDCHQTTDENLRIRTSIFPDDQNHYVYIPK
jgi:GTPase SAR1 family protein